MGLEYMKKWILKPLLFLPGDFMHLLLLLSFLPLFGNEEDHFSKIISHYSAGEYEKVVKEGKKFQKRYGESSKKEDVDLHIALSLAEEREPLEAISYFKRISIDTFKNKKRSFTIYLKLLKSLNMDNKIVEMGSEIESWGRGEDILILAWAFYDLENFQRSGEIFITLYREREDKDSLFGAISSLIREEDDKAIGYFKEYEEKFCDDRNYLEAIYTMVIQHFEKRLRNQEALAAHRKLVEIANRDSITKSLVVKLINLGHYKDAKRYSKMFNNLEDRSFFCGLSELNLGEYNLAKDNFIAILGSREEAYLYLMEALGNLRMDVSLIKYGLMYENEQYSKFKGEIYAKMLDSYLRLGDYQSALNICDKMSMIEEKRGYALFKKGEIYYNLGDYNEALGIYHDLIKSKESSYSEEALYSCVVIYDLLNRYKDLEEASKRFLESYPQSVYKGEILFYIGEVMVEKGDFAKALSYYRESVELMKSRLRKNGVILRIIETFLDKDKGHLIGELAKEVEGDGEKYRVMGRVKIALGENAEGIKYLRTALSNGDVESGVLLGDYYLANNNLTSAHKYYKKVRNRNSPFDDYVEFQIALVYGLMGKDIRASRILESLKKRTKNEKLLKKIEALLSKD